jgi:integral membrane protein
MRRGYRGAMADRASDAPARRLRAVSVLETVSFLVLVWMMVSHNDAGISVTGAIHGVLFLGYALLVLRDREVFGWSWAFVAVAILTGPVGAIVVLEKLRRS